MVHREVTVMLRLEMVGSGSGSCPVVGFSNGSV